MNDLLAKVHRLQALPEGDYRTYVYKTLRDAKRSQADTELLRDPDLVMRTAEALLVLRETNEQGLARLRATPPPPGDLAAVKDWQSKIRLREDSVAKIRAELKTVQPLANEEREKRSQMSRGKGPRHRAMVRLSKMHPRDFLDLVREEQAKDAERGRAN